MAKDRFPFPSRSQEESMEERDYSDSKIFHFFRTDLRWEISVHWSCDAGWECGFLIACLSWWDKKTVFQEFCALGLNHVPCCPSWFLVFIPWNLESVISESGFCHVILPFRPCLSGSVAVLQHMNWLFLILLLLCNPLLDSHMFQAWLGVFPPSDVGCVGHQEQLRLQKRHWTGQAT